jgi:hypothetical protein
VKARHWSPLDLACVVDEAELPGFNPGRLD